MRELRQPPVLISRRLRAVLCGAIGCGGCASRWTLGGGGIAVNLAWYFSGRAESLPL